MMWSIFFKIGADTPLTFEDMVWIMYCEFIIFQCYDYEINFL